MAPLMTSNVLSIGPLEGGAAEDEDGGLKAGVAPVNSIKQHRGLYEGVILINISQFGPPQPALLYRASPSFQPDSQGIRPGKSLAAVGGLGSSHK